MAEVQLITPLRAMRTILLCLVWLFYTKSAEDTCFHKDTNRSGKCLPLINCTYAFQGILNQKDPQVCRLGETAPIVCCPDNPPSVVESCFHTLTNENGICVPLINCTYAFYGAINQVKPQICRLGQTTPIVCCPIDTTPPTTPNPKSTISSRKCQEYFKSINAECRGKYLMDDSYAIAGEFPHMAAIYYDGVYRCFGSLISERYVLAPAYCIVYYGKKQREVHLGLLNLHSLENVRVQKFNIANITTHPKNNLESYYDLALIKLDGDVKFNQYVHPICLDDDDDDDDFEMQKSLLVGWTLFNRTLLSRPLKQASVEEVGKIECEGLYEDYIKPGSGLRYGVQLDGQFCARVKGRLVFAPGSSVQIPNKDNNCTNTLVGFYSYGPKKKSSIPNIFTRIRPYRTWIESVVWPEPESQEDFFYR